MKYRCDNRMAFDAALAAMTAEFTKAGYLEISTSGRKRSLDQNAMFYSWCREIAKARDDGTDERDVAAEIKLLKGFGLRRANDPAFDELLSKTIDKWWPEKNMWEPAVALAKEIECTSHLDKATMSKLLEWVQLWAWEAVQIRLEAK